MTNVKFIFTLLVIIFASIAQVFSQSVSDKTKAHLATFRTDYIDAMLHDEPDKISAYFAKNMRLMPEFQKTLLGKDNAKSYYTAFSRRFTVNDYKRTEVELTDLGDQVLEIGTAALHLTLKSSGQILELAGAYLDIWQK